MFKTGDKVAYICDSRLQEGIVKSVGTTCNDIEVCYMEFGGSIASWQLILSPIEKLRNRSKTFHNYMDGGAECDAIIKILEGGEDV